MRTCCEFAARTAARRTSRLLQEWADAPLNRLRRSVSIRTGTPMRELTSWVRSDLAEALLSAERYDHLPVCCRDAARRAARMLFEAAAIFIDMRLGELRSEALPIGELSPTNAENRSRGQLVRQMATYHVGVDREHAFGR